MKKFKLLFSLFTIALMFCGIIYVPDTKQNSATTDTAVSVQSDEPLIRYDFLPEDEMPILGYVGVPAANAGPAGAAAVNPSFFTKANLQRYMDAGFNILSGVYEKEPFHTPEIRKAMQLCGELGLTYFVADNAYRCDSESGSITATTTEQVLENMQDDWYLYEKAFGGIAVKDEPEAHDYSAMASVNEALQQLTDGKVLYTNLFPNYAEASRFGLTNPEGSAWDQYVRYATEFVEKVNPDILAYDFYVFMSKGATIESTLGKNNSIYDNVAAEINVNDYIKSLSLYRQLSQNYNVPFWVTVASYNHRNLNHFTQKQTEWTVNTSLAYGAKGIQYYTYWDATIGGSTFESWENQQERGLVTLNGTKHDAYYRIKKINDNIKTVDDVLMKATHKGVIQYGKQTLALIPSDTLYSYGLLSNISGGDSFVGCFEKDGKEVYYIVNNSINAGTQTLKADFLDKVNVRITNIDGVRTYDNVCSVGFNLSGGEAVLLEVL